MANNLLKKIGVGLLSSVLAMPLACNQTRSYGYLRQENPALYSEVNGEYLKIEEAKKSGDFKRMVSGYESNRQKIESTLGGKEKIKKLFPWLSGKDEDKAFTYLVWIRVEQAITDLSTSANN